MPVSPPDPRWRPNHCIPQVFPKYFPNIPQVFLTWLEFLDDEAPRPEVEAEPLRPLEFRLSLRSPKFKLTSLWVNEFDIDVEVLLALAELLLQLLEASTSPESLLRLTGLLPAKEIVKLTKNREIDAIVLMSATVWQFFQFERLHAMTGIGNQVNFLKLPLKIREITSRTYFWRVLAILNLCAAFLIKSAKDHWEHSLH